MDFKEWMIENVEMGRVLEDEAYEYTREMLADHADMRRKEAKEFHCDPDESGGVDENWPDTEGPTGIAGFRSGRYS